MAIPVSLEDAKRQLRQGGEDLDDERRVEVEGFIADAADWVERYTGHILAEREVVEPFYGATAAQLRAWPIKPGTTATISYTDDAGSDTTVAGARLDLAQRPARFVPVVGAAPFVGRPRPYTVTVKAGYAADDTVPGNFRRAMLILIGAFDRDREGGKVLADAEAAARRLCGDFRLRRV